MVNVRRPSTIRFAGNALLAIGIAASFNASSNTVLSLAEPSSSSTHITSEIVPSLGVGYWLHQNWMLDPSGHNVSGCVTRQIPGATSVRRTCFGSFDAVNGSGEYAGINRIIAVNGGAVAIGTRGTMNASGVCSNCSAWVLMMDDSGTLRWSKKLGKAPIHFNLNALLLRSDGSIWLAGNRQDLSTSQQQAWLGRISNSGDLLSEFTIDQRAIRFFGDFGYGTLEMASDYQFDIASMTAMPDGGFAVSGSAKFADGDPWAAGYVSDPSNARGFAARFDNAVTPAAIWARQYQSVDANIQYYDIHSNAHGEVVMVGQAMPTAPGLFMGPSQLEHLLTKIGADGVSQWSSLPQVATHTETPDFHSGAIDDRGNVFLQSSMRTSYSPIYTQTLISSFSPSGAPLYVINSVRENEGSSYSGYGGYGSLSDEIYPVGMYLRSDRQLVFGGESHALRRGLTVDLTSTDDIASIDPFSIFTNATALVTNSCLWTAPTPSITPAALAGSLYTETALSPSLQNVAERSLLTDWPIEQFITYMMLPNKVPLCSPVNK